MSFAVKRTHEAEWRKKLGDCKRLAADLHIMAQKPGEPDEDFVRRVIETKDAMVERSTQWYLNGAPRDGESKESYVERYYKRQPRMQQTGYGS